MQAVCVFCGSSIGRRPEYAAAVDEVARALLGARLRLVYGGARIGAMGRLADAVLAGGARWSASSRIAWRTSSWPTRA